MSRSYDTSRYTYKKNLKKPEWKCTCGYCLSNKYHKHLRKTTVKQELKLMEEEKLSEETIEFLERLESMTKDKATAQAIAFYLREKGVWD